MGLAGRIGGGNKLKTNILATQLGMLSMVGLIALLLIKQEDIDRGIINFWCGYHQELKVDWHFGCAGGAKVQKILGSVTLVLRLLGNRPSWYVQ